MNQSTWSISLKDLFTKKMLQYSMVPFFGTLLIMYTLFFGVAGAGIDALQQSSLQIEHTEQTMQNGVVQEEHESIALEGASAILRFLMEHTITSWLVSFIVFTVGGFITFIIAMFVALVIIGFMTPVIVREIHRRHYPHLPLQHHGSVPGIVFASLRHLLVMLLLMLLLLPFYFVPILNLIAFNLPFYYLFHKLYLIDVSSETMTKERFKSVMFLQGNRVRLTTLTLYLISLIPFAAYITPVFNVIVLTHTLLRGRIQNEAHESAPEIGSETPRRISAV